MTPPSIAARRLLASVVLGMLLGIIYEFLRPLRRKRNWPADLLFFPAALWLWAELAFRFCRTDLRAGNLIVFFLSALFADTAVRPWLSPVFEGFWTGIRSIFHIFLFPFKKFINFTAHFLKYHYAIRKKWGTIDWHIQKQKRQESGGVTHGKKKNIPSRL